MFSRDVLSSPRWRSGLVSPCKTTAALDPSPLSPIVSISFFALNCTCRLRLHARWKKSVPKDFSSKREAASGKMDTLANAEAYRKIASKYRVITDAPRVGWAEPPAITRDSATPVGLADGEVARSVVVLLLVLLGLCFLAIVPYRRATMQAAQFQPRKWLTS